MKKITYWQRTDIVTEALSDWCFYRLPRLPDKPSRCVTYCYLYPTVILVALIVVNIAAYYVSIVLLIEIAVRRLIGSDQAESFWGDLHERRAILSIQVGSFRAGCWFWRQVTASLLPLAWAVLQTKFRRAV